MSQSSNAAHTPTSPNNGRAQMVSIPSSVLESLVAQAASNTATLAAERDEYLRRLCTLGSHTKASECAKRNKRRRENRKRDKSEPTNTIRKRLLAQGQTHYGDKPDKHPVPEASCTLCTPEAMPPANHADEHSTSIELPGVHLNPSIDEIKGAPTDGIDPEEPPTLELPPVIQIPEQWKNSPCYKKRSAAASPEPILNPTTVRHGTLDDQTSPCHQLNPAGGKKRRLLLFEKDLTQSTFQPSPARAAARAAAPLPRRPAFPDPYYGCSPATPTTGRPAVTSVSPTPTAPTTPGAPSNSES